jgi:hypothetical protein
MQRLLNRHAVIIHPNQPFPKWPPFFFSFFFLSSLSFITLNTAPQYFTVVFYISHDRDYVRSLFALNFPFFRIVATASRFRSSFKIRKPELSLGMTCCVVRHLI